MKRISVSEQEKKKLQLVEAKILDEVDRICKKHDLKYGLAYGTLIGAIRHNGYIPWDDDLDICMPRADFERFREICKTELDSRFFYQTQSTDSEYYHLFDKIRMNNTIFRETFLSDKNIHHGVYIDIFPIDNIPDDINERRKQFKKFHFYRTGLMVKYLNLQARTGKKKIFAAILRAIYLPFSVQYLYNKAIEISKQYSNQNTNEVMSFYSPYKERDIFEREVWSRFEYHEFENSKYLIPSEYDLILSKIYGRYMELPPKEQQITRHDLVELSLNL